MSDITISRPEVVTGHTDVICSTSIRHVVTVRNSSTATNRNAYPATGRNLSADSRHWRQNRPGLGDETEFSLWLLADGKTGSSNESHHPQSRSRNLA